VMSPVSGTLRLLTLLFAAITLGSGTALADEFDMDREIDFLLESVASSDCVFIRNGDEHDPVAARDHLAMKRKRGKRYYDTTEEFIERIASRSSWSGKDYYIRCGAGEPQTASDWFTARLLEYRGTQSADR
jgi:hypothetical protein